MSEWPTGALAGVLSVLGAAALWGLFRLLSRLLALFELREANRKVKADFADRLAKLEAEHGETRKLADRAIRAAAAKLNSQELTKLAQESY